LIIKEHKMLKKILIHETKSDSMPREVGYNSQYINYLDDLFIRLIEEKKLQCASYILARRGRIFAQKSLGRLSGINPGAGDFMPDSIRKLASATIVFTATAIAQLIERGRLYLEQPVADILKEFDNPYFNRIQLSIF